MHSNQARRLAELEAIAANRKAQQSLGHAAKDRIMAKLEAIGTCLRDAGVELEPLSAEEMAERIAGIKAHLKHAASQLQGRRLYGN
jgi:hypothetical protein